MTGSAGGAGSSSLAAATSSTATTSLLSTDSSGAGVSTTVSICDEEGNKSDVRYDQRCRVE